MFILKFRTGRMLSRWTLARKKVGKESKKKNQTKKEGKRIKETKLMACEVVGSLIYIIITLFPNSLIKT